MCIRSIQTQQQTIVAQSWSIHRFLVDEYRVNYPADLHELLPVAAIARKARDLARRDRPDAAQAHLGDHALETAARLGAGGRASEILVNHLDLAPAQITQPRLHRVLHYDALTGLANRILFSDRLQHAVLQTRRLGLAVGVLYIGADLSGLFGEKYGKPVEEKFQMLLAQRLKDLVAEGDTVARLGREEFAILHKCEREMQDMEQIARRVTAEFAVPMQAAGYELDAFPWVGISRYPEHGERADDLLDHAAIAMRHARDHGRAPFDFYRREMQPGNRRVNG